MAHLTLSERVSRLENHFYFGVTKEEENAGPNTGFRLRDQDENAEPDYRQHLDKVGQHQERAGPSPKQADQTAFEEIIARISSCNDRVCLTADKLQKIGDRIMGELPQNTEEMAAGAQRSPDGTLDHTFMALNWLDQSLGRLEQVALRMERV